MATDDGDFVDLDWVGAGPGTPVVLALHGLEGSSRSHYVSGLFQEVLARGWRGVALNFRSCSGEPNRRPRFYHSGDTGDLDAIVRRLVEREPGVPLGAVGTSLGGNVLLKWLGEQGEAAPAELAAAVGISVPFDLAACAAALDRGVGRALYTPQFLRSLKKKVREKARHFPGFVDVAAVLRARTFAEYDRVLTAPLHGFADERDYWARSSSGPYLARVRRPALLIGSLDDPIVPPESLPGPAGLPPWVEVEWTGHGGHAGFIESLRPGRPSWAERRALGFLESRLRAPAGAGRLVSRR